MSSASATPAEGPVLLAHATVTQTRSDLDALASGAVRAAVRHIDLDAVRAKGLAGHERVRLADGTLLTRSLWHSYEDLHAFAFRSPHGTVLRRRHWFERHDGPSTVLWWHSGSHVPGIEEALGRLALLRREGPNPRAFTPRRQFPHPSDKRGRA